MKKLNLAAAAFAAFAIASAALGQLSKYKDWAKSPEAYFLTAPERQEWSKVASDADAEKFIAAYWANRGGDKFREAVLRRIAAADEQFKMRRQKGSESARGRIFITLGAPSRVTESRSPSGGPDSGTDAGRAGTGVGALQDTQGQTTVTQTWIYQKDKFDPSWGVGELQARIDVDPQRGTDELVNGGPVNKAIEKVVEHAIVSPATPAEAAAGAVKPAVPPAASGPAAAAGAPAPAAPPAPAATAAIPAAARSALEAIAKEKPSTETTVFWGGPFRTVTGEPFYAFRLTAPADKVAAGAALKLGGVVTRQDGTEASSFWEDAALSDARTGTRVDKAADHSVVLPPGSYQGSFGLFPADGGAAIVSASSAIVIESNADAFTVSPLILATTLTPLTKRPNPTDPFVFGMEKPIRVEPKANHLFTREDSLWYFYTVSNPVTPAAPAAPTTSAAPAASGSASAPAASTTPAPGAATSPTPGAAAAPGAAATPAKPRVMTRIGVLRDGKPAFQPATMPAELQPLGMNYYASGSEIPLATFEPGYYTFTVNIRDLNAPKDSAASKGVDRSGDFTVLMPDWSMPPKPTPVPAKPTPRPRKKS